MSSEREMLEWMPFETFATMEEAKAMLEMLEENSIEAEILNDANMGVDPLGLDFQNRGADACIVRVRAKDIDTARRLLEASVHAASASAADAASMEMLKSFSDEELLDILKAPDEWNPENVELSRRILASHGKEFSDADMKHFFDERVESLKKPVPVSAASVLAAYIAAVAVLVVSGVNYLYLGNVHYLYLLVGAFIVSCLALIAGLNWTYRKKRLPNGEKVFVYSKRLRMFSFAEMVLAAFALGMTVIDIAVRTMG